MDGEEQKIVDQNQDAGDQPPADAQADGSQPPADNADAGAPGEGGDPEAQADGDAGAADGEDGDIKDAAGDDDEEVKGGDDDQQDLNPDENRSQASSQMDYISDPRIAWMLSYLEELQNYEADNELTAPTNTRLKPFYTFLEKSEYKNLFVWVCFVSGELTYSYERAPQFYEAEKAIKSQDYQVVYFLKREKDARITATNIEQTLLVGQFDSDPLESLLGLMNDTTPKLLGENEWPENVKKEFVSNLHNFMAVITEVSYAAKGMTNLYIPNEDLSDLDTATKDKDLMQRLEQIVICWTRQIKDLVTNQDSINSYDNTSPLDEIKHWSDRTANLNVLTTKLKEPKLSKIIEALEMHKSSYLNQFVDLQKRIHSSFDEAQDNLKFLKILEEPCRKIEKAHPAEIPKLLPDVLSAVRIIWELSGNYSSEERMKGLLTKISNQIIQRCRAKINKEDMLGNDVEKCMRDLDESIDCCQQWREICTKAQRRIQEHSDKKSWDMENMSAIFAENEAFIQRCKELKEICEGQLQFALKGASCKMPVFGGSKSKDWSDSLKSLKTMFEGYLDKIKNLEYDILDVKITKWHDDYGSMFKENVKQLENIYTTIIAKTFHHVSNIEEAVEMLENFYQLGKRPNIIEYVQTKAAEQVYNMFIAEMNEVEEIFENGHQKKAPPMSLSHPHHSGIGIWAYSLIQRIDRAKRAIDGIFFVKDHPKRQEAEKIYKKLKEQQLDNFINKQAFKEWETKTEDLQKETAITEALDQKILIKTTQEILNAQPSFLQKNPAFAKSRQVGLLESNFNTPLYKVLQEIKYWNKIGSQGLINMPIQFARLSTKQDQLRIFRENVMLIVRDYNNIINMINDREKSLFKEHMAELDKFINRGINFYSWNGNAESFAIQCRNQCENTLLKIKIFQERNGQISDEMEKIQTTILTQIKKQLYEINDFMGQQNTILKKNENSFEASFEKIRGLLMSTYQDLFLYHGRGIQKEWLDNIHQMDKELEKSLKASVKGTLLDLQHHIKGEQEIVPIFQVFLVIDTSGLDWQVNHDPSHKELKTNIDSLISNIINVTSVVPRIETVFRDDRLAILNGLKAQIQQHASGAQVPIDVSNMVSKIYGNTFLNLTPDERDTLWKKQFNLDQKTKTSDYKYIEKVKKHGAIDTIVKTIKTTVDNIQFKMNETSQLWLKNQEFKQIQHMQRDNYLRRFLKNSMNDGGDDEVTKYKYAIDQLIEYISDVKAGDITKIEQFIVIHYSRLKNELIEKGNARIQTLFQKFVNESKQDLYKFLQELQDIVEQLKTPCSSHEQLRTNRRNERIVRDDMASMKARIEPIKKKFEFIMDENAVDIGNVELTDEDKNALQSLDKAWKDFEIGMMEAKSIIQKTFQEFKQTMEDEIDEFKKFVEENLVNFKKMAPFMVTPEFEQNGNKKAFEQISHFSDECKNLRKQEDDMQLGLDIFEITPDNYTNLKMVEKDNASLHKIWSIKQQWDAKWDVWRKVNFYELDAVEMEDCATEVLHALNQLPKEDRKWKVSEFIQELIFTFQETMPLMVDLRQEYMRDRHWKDLRAEVQEDFDETSPDFTLQVVYNLNLIDHTDAIQKITGDAKAELRIETGLRDINYMWTKDPATNLDIVEIFTKGSGDKCYKINSTDQIIATYEQHSGDLSGFKATRFYKQFDQEIDKWETDLGQITETLELLGVVQEKWQYLESIFGGPADYARQMPKENTIFGQVDVRFKEQMERLANNKNALSSLVEENPDFMNILTELNEHLEKIQISLQQWLKQKRQIFPRFFFLPDDDLLEIIGQSSDPSPINKHIKKIFEGIHYLESEPTSQSKGPKVYHITAVHSNAEPSIEREELKLSEPAVEVTSQVQEWFKSLQKSVTYSLQKEFYNYYTQVQMQNSRKPLEKDRLLEQIKKNIGQVLLTCAQIQWTKEVTDALQAYEMNQGAPTGAGHLKKLKNTYRKRVETYIQCVESKNLSTVNRLKIIALIIMEEHNREVIDKLFANKSISSTSFDWLSQLRFERDADQGSEQMLISIEQLNARLDYQYEYQGNNGRLVVTPLTDRAYMTLTNALEMRRGGAPQGPAGTGKTETVKDLGKNIAQYVFILNCSEQLTADSLGGVFTGLAMTGCWGCFDEFNRILPDVLSVITNMIQQILDTIKKGSGAVNIGDSSTFNPKETTGLFITMNPGYAGRSELPDNLAALFRPVAMMAPDFQAIAKITLMSEGFLKNDELSKKIHTIYQLLKRQLSQQPHYDFSMRAIKSVLSASGRIKREMPQLDEVKVVLKAIRDMNLPKFISDDTSLFDNLFMDLFPDIEEPEVDRDMLQISIEQCMLKRGLQLDESIVVKTMQLYDNKEIRHGNMLVGATMSGKSTCWEILQEALNRLHKIEKEEKEEKGDKSTVFQYAPVKVDVINPKSINENELYGSFDDQSPPQWQQGVLAEVLKDQVKDQTITKRWMILDGPVDTSWIESMNSVLDDSKRLTLTNCDVIQLSPSVRLLFEVENLLQASPATVSRAGMIFVDIDDLNWKQIFRSWLQTKSEYGEEYTDHIQDCANRYIEPILKHKALACNEIVLTSDNACIRNMTVLFDAVEHNYSEFKSQMSTEDYLPVIEKWFVFSIIWSVGATVDELGRKELDLIFRDIEPMFPTMNTVFDYCIDMKKNKDWNPWESKISPAQSTFKGKEFHELYIPTVDFARNRFVIQDLMKVKQQILCVGTSGVGKTVLIEKTILQGLGDLELSFTINFSAGTTSKGCQEVIESNFDKRANNKFKPKNSNIKAICFIDDLNMPREDRYGSQPPLELLRQWIDHGFWYDRQKVVRNLMQDMQILAAMGKPGGGRRVISNRIVSKFHLLTFTQLTEQNMMKIYTALADHKFSLFYEEIKTLIDPIAQATINLFNIVQDEFLPTPTKPHYQFNMRDISKVFQGLYLADRYIYEQKEQVVKLWGHEVLRVFADRLINVEDQQKFKKLLNDQLESQFSMNYKEHCMTNQATDAIFADFLVDEDAEEEKKCYDEVTDFDKLVQFLANKLDEQKREPKQAKLDIVLFRDAVIHVCKIYRVLNLKRGHALLVGVGGSGRHSLTRLAAFVGNMNADQIEIKKGFNLRMFRQKLKELYELSAYNGARGRRPRLKTVFLFSDNDAIHESFLEDIQNMLNGGIVPNIYNADELANVRDEMKQQYKLDGKTNEQPAVMNEWFFNRVKDNMHLSICMSPVGDKFKDYTRNFPALINNTTIDWFMAWPEEALIEVAESYINRMDIDDQYKSPLARMAGYIFDQVKQQSDRMAAELKRIYYVTPTNFIDMVLGYEKILAQKRNEIRKQIKKLSNGLAKLEESEQQVLQMNEESEIKRADVAKKSQEVQEVKIQLARDEKVANETQQEIMKKTEIVNTEREIALKLAEEAQYQLGLALPALEEADEAVQSLDKKSIGEVRAYAAPPRDIRNVMAAVMTVLNKATDWPAIKKEMADPKFMDKIKGLDKDHMSEGIMKKIEAFTKVDTFHPAYLRQKSVVAEKLCIWVKAVEDYHKALKIVRPKQEKRDAALAKLKSLEDSLKAMEEEYAVLEAQLKKLQDQLDEYTKQMDEFRNSLENLQTRIERGDRLVNSLSEERDRWNSSLSDLRDQDNELTGNAILSAAFMSLNGPFPADFREGLLDLWMRQIRALQIPHTQGFQFADFLSTPATTRGWQIDGLPVDNFSTENGVMITKGQRWVLNIDPQTQANNWIRRTYQKHLIVLDMTDPKYIDKISNAVKNGKIVLLQDVGEVLDPALDNLFGKVLVKSGGEYVVKIGENEIPWSNKFKLFITTRIPNPTYTPEVSTKVNVVNFSIKEQGLEEQCLGIVVQIKQPQIEAAKNTFVEKIETGKKKLLELEDDILNKLQAESDVPLVDNIELIQVLAVSKETQTNVQQSLENAQTGMKKINETREQFSPCGKVAAALFFVLIDLHKINPMYQFSLNWYKDLFTQSISDAKETTGAQNDQITQINKKHILNVYLATCKTLFERHKLLLSFQLAIKLEMMRNPNFDYEEYLFFLRGGMGLGDNKGFLQKPPGQDWITDVAWGHLTELEHQLPKSFNTLTQGITLNVREWKAWFSSRRPVPEENQLPGEWETRCEEPLKKMIVLRCFRPDRVNFAVRKYVQSVLGDKEFVQSKATTLPEIFEDSAPMKPIIIILSQGADPTEQIYKVAEERDQEIRSISLGKGQEKKAIAFITENAAEGTWCFLSNCHLSTSLLPELEATLDDIQLKKAYNDQFRLIMSAAPSHDFPISLLQKSVKMTMEPPRGIKANMIRLYKNMGSKFKECERDMAFRKSIYGLCWFHTILIERKKFKTLGWNSDYAFNDSDYLVCEDTLALRMGQYNKEHMPPPDYNKKAPIDWIAVQKLIADANYGGRVTDDLDRRLLNVYAFEIFNDELIQTEKWRPAGAASSNYAYPLEENQSSKAVDPSAFEPSIFISAIQEHMDQEDAPDAYGQHANAEINSQQLDSLELLSSILSLQPALSGSSGESPEQATLKLIEQLQQQMPVELDYATLRYKMSKDSDPLSVVLVQEISRYNALLQLIRDSLFKLDRALKGLELITPELEVINQSFNENKVPDLWSQAYFSLKPLGSWVKDLGERYNFFTEWVQNGSHTAFWISAFTYPNAFTTALMQRYSRKAGMPSIDKLDFDYLPMNRSLSDFVEPAKDGAYVYGLSLEGAKWEEEKGHLCEPEVMELFVPMPVIHFKPIPKRTKAQQNVYECPVYYYPIRKGSVAKDSFMFMIDLKLGPEQTPEFWVKRGTALLMSLPS